MKIRLAVATLVTGLLIVPTARAATIVGQASAMPDFDGTCGTGDDDLGLQAANLVDGLPVSGVITSWSASGPTASASPGVQAFVSRAAAEPDWYTLVGESAAVTLPRGATGTFPTRLPVQAGDFLGLDVQSGSGVPCLGSGPNAVEISVADHLQPFADRYQPDDTITPDAALKLASLKATAGGRASGAVSASVAGRLRWTGRAGTTVVVSGSASVAAGRHALKLKLNAAGRKLVKRKRRLSVKLQLTLTTATGPAATAKKTLTFKR